MARTGTVNPPAPNRTSTLASDQICWSGSTDVGYQPFDVCSALLSGGGAARDSRSLLPWVRALRVAVFHPDGVQAFQMRLEAPAEVGEVAFRGAPQGLGHCAQPGESEVVHGARGVGVLGPDVRLTTQDVASLLGAQLGRHGFEGV